MVIEGMAIALLMGVGVGYKLHPTMNLDIYEAAAEALAERGRRRVHRERDILASGFWFELAQCPRLRRLISRRGTAVDRSLEGKKGLPRFKPPFPRVRALRQATDDHNTGDFRRRALDVNHARRHSSRSGAEQRGTKIFSVTGHVAAPRNYEVKLGTPFAKLLEMRRRDARRTQAQA